MNVQLHLGDCLDVLRTLDSGSIDAVLTDPPYGVRREAWDDMSDKEFARFSMAWLAEAKRVSRELVVFCTQDSVIYDLCRMMYGRVRRLIWNKPPGSQYAGARECGLWFAYEVILHCHDRESWSVVKPKDAGVGRAIGGARRKAGMSRGAVDIAVRGKKTGLCYRWEEGSCLPTPEQSVALKRILPIGDDYDSAMELEVAARDETVSAAREEASRHAARSMDVLTHRPVTNVLHPCEKPVDLLIEVIQGLGGQWSRIADPFMGSGSTGVACVKTGRDFIGIEADAAYYEIASRRIESEQEKTPLLTA